MSKADLDKKPFDVARMFDAVGEKYDLTNTVLSFGQDAHWRKRTRERLNLQPGELVLDLAAGTAVSTRKMRSPGCTGCRPAASRSARCITISATRKRRFAP